MAKREWEQRLPDGVRMASDDSDGFRLGVSLPVGDDGMTMAADSARVRVAQG